MAFGNESVRNIVDKTMEEFKKRASLEYSELPLNRQIQDAVMKAAMEVAKEHIQISEEFRPHFDHSEIGIKTILGTHLPPYRIDGFYEALKIPTFTMNISKKSDDLLWVETYRGGKEFYPPENLQSKDDTERALYRQYASILIEAVLLIMSINGIKTSFSERVMETVVDETSKAFTKSFQLVKAMETFIEEWNKAGTNNWSKALAIFHLIMSINGWKIVSTIVKLLIQEMSGSDRLIMFGRFLAMTAVLTMTSGVALTAKIFLAVTDAVAFVKKIRNVTTLIEHMKKM